MEREQAQELLWAASDAHDAAVVAWFIRTPTGRAQIAAHREWKAAKDAHERAGHIPVERVKRALESVPLSYYESYDTKHGVHAMEPSVVKQMIKIMEEQMRDLAALVDYVDRVRVDPLPLTTEPEMRVVKDDTEEYRAYEATLKALESAREALPAHKRRKVDEDEERETILEFLHHTS